MQVKNYLKRLRTHEVIEGYLLILAVFTYLKNFNWLALEERVVWSRWLYGINYRVYQVLQAKYKVIQIGHELMMLLKFLISFSYLFPILSILIKECFSKKLLDQDNYMKWIIDQI